MKNRIVFIGEFTPMQKVLGAIRKISNCRYLSLYTPLGDNLTTENLAKKLDLQIIDINVLETRAGEKQLKEFKPDWLFNVNSTIILPSSILNVPTQGALNLHPGKLPEYAGLFPYQWALRNNETTFAVTLHWMKEAVDSGPIAYTKEFQITEKDTGMSVFMKCTHLGVDLVLQALGDIAIGKQPPQQAQDLSRRKIYLKKDSIDGKIEWNHTARQIFNFVRAVDYYPFESPTYSPTFQTNENETVIVRKARLSQKPSHSSGEIILINDEGIVVGAGDGLSVLISEVQLQNKSILKGREVGSELGLSVGSQLAVH